MFPSVNHRHTSSELENSRLGVAHAHEGGLADGSARTEKREISERHRGVRIPMKVATDSSQSNGMVRGSSGVGCPLPNGYTARGKKKGEDVRTRLPPDTNQTFSLSKELR